MKRQKLAIETIAEELAMIELCKQYRSEKGIVRIDAIYRHLFPRPVMKSEPQQLFDSIYLTTLERLMDQEGIPAVTLPHIPGDNYYETRNDYINHLAAENGVDAYTVKIFAELYGPDEDFGALPLAVKRESAMRKFPSECWPGDI
ncbi:MAG: hypothetical protein LUF87_02100 [Alistipes sp.]|nr:hypothetical protein [Alistipes sp.]